jgi:hypothetical protein
MQKHGFEIHNVFCSTPGDLANELQCFYRVAGEVNEATGMPHNTLFAGVALRSNNHNFIAGDDAKDNVRHCSFFVQVFEGSWGPAGLFRELFDLAEICMKDEQAPMRGIAVFVKAPASLEIAGANIRRYESTESFESQLREVMTEWLRSVIPQARDASA